MEQKMEILAYIGSLIILISFCTKNVKLLRILNNVGCLIFLIYAIYHNRIPLIFLNSSIILINIYYLLKLKDKD
jgi:hypothetical protein